MEEEFIRNQERLKPQEEKNEEERSKVDDLRGKHTYKTKALENGSINF
jgi:hypothetical protein